MRTSSGRSASSSRWRSSSTSAFSGFCLAQLFLDGPELLAEHVLALLLAHLGLGLAGDLLPQLQHLQLVGQVAVQQPQGLEPGGGLEQGLLLRHVQAEHRAEQVGQHQRVLGLGRELLDVDPRVGLGQLERLGGQVEHGAAEGLDLGPLVVGQRQRADPGLEIRLGLLQPDQRHALEPLDQELDARSPERAIFLMTARVPTV